MRCSCKLQACFKASLLNTRQFWKNCHCTENASPPRNIKTESENHALGFPWCKMYDSIGELTVRPMQVFTPHKTLSAANNAELSRGTKRSNVLYVPASPQSTVGNSLKNHNVIIESRSKPHWLRNSCIESRFSS